MGGLRVSPVVLNLIIINALMFFGTSFLMGDGRYLLAVYFPASEFFQPFQIITHMFMHANLEHLFFNMLMLFFLGPPLEHVLGKKRFLFYYLVAGFGALALSLLMQYMDIHYFGMNTVDIPMLGASGAIFGVAVGFAMFFPDSIIQLLIPPIPIKAKYFVLILVAIDLFSGIGRINPGVAHFAHLGGALFGFLMIIFWRKYGTPKWLN